MAHPDAKAALVTGANSANPGFPATDMNGQPGTQTIEPGARPW